MQKIELEENLKKVMGIALERVDSYESNPKVDIQFRPTESGPSGGLITTLEIYNQLTEKDLTGGYQIAGTGTIELDGTIGTIGGVEHKLLGEWKNNQMHGYGEFIWVEGKKYIGFYKNDKKEGFGIYYWPNDRFFVGFWKEGKQNGVGKFIKDDVFKYGVWKNGKREKWFKDEEEFMEELKKKNKKYSFLFKSDINKLKKYMDLDDNSEEESEYESNKDFKNVEDLNNKNEQSEEEEEV